MSPRRLAALISLAIAAPPQALAQGRTFVPNGPLMAELRAEDLQGLLEAAKQANVGRLAALPDVRSAYDLGVQRLEAKQQREREIVAAAAALGIHARVDVPTLLDFGITGVRGFRQIVLAPDTDRTVPTRILALMPTPRAEGKLSMELERLRARLENNPRWQRDDSVRLDGGPISAYRAVPSEENGELSPHEYRGSWLAHLPGLFLCGDETPDQCGTLQPAAAPRTDFAMTMHMASYLKMFQRQGGAVPAEFAALGFDALKSLEWRVRLLGDDLLDEQTVELDGKPRALIAALLQGTAKLPAQALPGEALFQLRCAIDPKPLWASVQGLVGAQDQIPAEIRKDLEAAFTGGLALGVTAPAKGGVIPRLFVSAELADLKAAARLLSLVPAEQRKEVTYEGVVCTVMTLGGLPPALQPTTCVRNGVLHLAESPRSMRTFLQTQKAGGEAMEIGDTPLPEGPGEVVPSLDLRFDAAAMYRAFYELWLPLYELQVAATNQSGVRISRDEMPEPATIEALLGKGRGILRHDGDRYTLQQRSSLGGFELAALAMTLGPILLAEMSNGAQTSNLLNQIGAKKLEAVWTVLSSFHEQHGRWPANLGELFQDRRLPIDALYMTGDELAEPVELPAGDTRVIRSSFRYYPETVAVNSGGQTHALLLVSILPAPYRRAVLADNGEQPRMWGTASSQPIDAFGK
jgi:hypothetical protein